ncbi:MAG TPA: HlyD family efflux transporter periplasmic adaptor subunit [Bryobacteraceae bacterium]|nr:HlyD family efflux transporter periplasmic adaptor subunit [Bryobacteraceae bacterium]
MSARARRIRFWAVTCLLAASLAATGAGIYRMRQAGPASELPLAPARKGEFLVMIRCRGNLMAGRSAEINTPIVPNLRISWMAPAGVMVKAGDPIIRFDSSSAQQTLAQKEAQLRQNQASLDQAVAQARINAEQDASDLAQAKYKVETARMEASKADILSKIDGDEKKIDLSVAEQALKVEEATVGLHAASDKSKIASATRLRDQAQADVDITKRRIAQMEIRAPIAGVPNYASNYTQGWNNVRPFKVGDNVFAGMNLAEIPDANTLEMDVKVEETDRGRIAIGNDVRVHIDSLPELDLAARLDRISPLAELTTNEWPPTRAFHAYARLLRPDPRLTPGMNGGMDIIVRRLPNAVSIPSKAIFTRNGKPAVYVARGGSFATVEVAIQARNPDEVAVTGLRDGAMVALADVTRTESKETR